MQLSRSSLLTSQLALLVVGLMGAVAASQHADWRPLSLLALLVVVAVVSDGLAARVKGLRISGSFPPLVLAMALLGPAPAAAMGVVVIAADTLRSRPPLVHALNNLATCLIFPLAGGLLVDQAQASAGLDPRSVLFLVLVFGVFLLTNVLNFVLVVGADCLADGRSLAAAFRTIFLPVLPSQAAAGLLTAAIAVIYGYVGFGALALLGGVLVTFQYLVRELLRSQERAEELRKRSTQLASLQIGVLAVMLQTLSLRDRMTARHSAAVARYSRELARMLGCDERAQDLVHTAGLLHDIGKFIFPDDILFADRRLTDEDWQTVQRHPAQGARVVAKVDGYGPVAELVLSHHERVDGTGYPRRLIGDAIPLLARIIAVADTYDVLTARDSYRRPVHPEEAIEELIRVRGAQLDAHVVDAFVALLAEKGVAFQHGDDADFEAELAFTARVHAQARPAGSRLSAAV